MKLDSRYRKGSERRESHRCFMVNFRVPLHPEYIIKRFFTPNQTGRIYIFFLWCRYSTENISTDWHYLYAHSFICIVFHHCFHRLALHIRLIISKKSFFSQIFLLFTEFYATVFFFVGNINCLWEYIVPLILPLILKTLKTVTKSDNFYPWNVDNRKIFRISRSITQDVSFILFIL